MTRAAKRKKPELIPIKFKNVKEVMGYIKTKKSIGQIAYETRQRVLFNDGMIPVLFAWHDISSKAKKEWDSVAKAVAREVKRRMKENKNKK